MKRREVYLDNNATTRVDEEVVKLMNKYFLEEYAVASSQFSHSPGIRAKEGVENAREIIAKSINAHPKEIIFTSGETESNNLAIKGLLLAAGNSKRKKIIVSSIEHISVLNIAKKLKKWGYPVEFIPVDGEGFIDIDFLYKNVDDETLLVSVIHGNHEVGTIQNLKTISAIVHEKGAYFHTDATYSFMQVPIDVIKEKVDLMTISADKIHGPKGVGALYVRSGTKIEKIMDGGYQEFDLRAGVENVPGIVGFGKACEIYNQEYTKVVSEMRDHLYKKITEEVDGVMLNGPEDFTKRLPNNLNLTFQYVEGESVVLHLDMRGISVITGSACFSRSLHASHVLLAMGFSHERAHGSIRFSPSKYTTPDDIDYTVLHIKEVVNNLRKLSPLTK